MQSILQYKRFGRRARDQYERDKKRAEALERGNAENDAEGNANVQDRGHRPSSIDSRSSNTKVPSPGQSPDSRDPEKAEQPGREDQNGAENEGQHGESLDRNRTLSTVGTNQRFGTRMGHILSGIEVRLLSNEMTRKRKTKSGRTPTNEKEPEQETVSIVGYESESEKDNMNPHKLGIRNTNRSNHSHRLDRFHRRFRILHRLGSSRSSIRRIRRQ
jgi:hypothetical protein